MMISILPCVTLSTNFDFSTL